MFAKKLTTAILQKNSRVCVGLDPRLELIPEKIQNEAVDKYGKTFQAAAEAIHVFNKQVIDVVADHVPVIKPQLAFYEQYGSAGIVAFEDTVAYAHEKGLLVIADAKRNDIGSTSQAYANAFLGKTNIFEEEKFVFNADALTINPFLGEDSLLPFIETCDKYGKGIFVLVKTSNSGSKDLQDLVVDETVNEKTNEGKSLVRETVSEKLAKIIDKHAQLPKGDSSYSSIGAVVGATFPEEANVLRKLMPNSIFLVPGIGAQGGDLNSLAVFFDKEGLGAIVNSSRGIVFPKEAQGRDNYLEIIEGKAKELKEQINEVLGK